MAERPARPFVEVGLVEVQEKRGNYSASELMEALRSRAGEAGCDGVIFLGDNDAVASSTSTRVNTTTAPAMTGTGSTTTSTANTSTQTGTLNGYRGSCIVYSDATAAAPGA